jgi:hypothetical protein
MKTLSFRALCLLSLLLSVASHADDSIALSHDIANSAHIAKETPLDNAYLSFSAKDAMYYAGFTIEKNGTNQPTLVEVNKISGTKAAWRFDDIIADVFVFKSMVSVVLDSGVVYSLNTGRWERSSLVLAERSRIVFGDGKKRLISCSPSSLFKDDTRVGGCESYNPSWTISFPWHDVKPKICGELLYAVTWEKRQNQHIAINLESGEIVYQRAYAGEDVCAPLDK